MICNEFPKLVGDVLPYVKNFYSKCVYSNIEIGHLVQYNNLLNIEKFDKWKSLGNEHII